MIDYDSILNSIKEDSVEKTETKIDENKGILKVGSGLDLNGPGITLTGPFDVSIVANQFGVEEVDALVKKAEAFAVETDQEARNGVNLALEARKMNKDIQETRKEITKPYVLFQKECIAEEKKYTSLLDSIENNLLEMVGKYQDERKKKLAEHEIDDPSFDFLQVSYGSSSIKTYYETKVDNFNEIPREWLKIDQKKIDEAVKAGIRQIPGITIIKSEKRQFRLKSTRNKTRKISMNEQLKIIEINGIKMEVDMRTVKIIDNFRIGDKVKLLLKEYTSYVSYPAIIVGFDQFKELPTIVIAYVKSSYTDTDIRFVYFNSSSEDVEICKSYDHDIEIDKKNVLRSFEAKIKECEATISDIERKKKYFLTNFNKHFTVCEKKK